MKTKLAILICLLLVPFTAFGQFDFGPGGPSSPAASVAPWKEKPFKLNPKTRIKLDFQNASIDAIVKFYSEHSGITVVKDPALTGTLNISSAKAVSLSDAFTILQATLNLKNYEIAKQDNLLVIRQRDSGGGGRNQSSMQFDPSMLTTFLQGNTNLKVYPITYANASQVARVINDVFASATDPMSMLQQMMGGGQQNGRNQGRNQARPGQGGFNFQRGGFGGSQPSVKASYDDFSNAVIVNAPNNMQEQVHDLIMKIDKKTDDPQKSKVFKMNFASSDDLVTVVQNVLNSSAPRGRGGATTQQQQGPQAFINALRGTNAGSGTVVSDPRTNSLIVTATQENLDIVAKLIPELDVEVKTENAAFVVHLDNAKADVIATLLQQAWGTKSGTTGATNRTNTGTTNRTNTTQNTNNRTGAGGGNNGGGRLGGSLPPDELAVKDADGKTLDLAMENPDDDSGLLYTSIGVQQGGGFRQVLGGGAQGTRTNTGQGTGRDSQGRLVNVRDLTNQITVIPDINTNSLIVVGTPDQAELLRSIVEQLDKIPEQVMIETMIVEANLDATTKLGVEWKYNDSHNGAQQTYGIQNSTTNPAQGLLYTFTGSRLTAFVNAIKTDNNFSILSTPRIFTSNNVQAEINISQSIPYVLSTIQDANGNLSFNYSFQDVGIVLTVTPRITSNGYVTLDVTQTANDLQGYTSFNAPIVNKREADTTVSVKDGETIILGGIIRNTVTTTTNKIPILGDIPLLGNLFKSTSKQKSKTELLVFLTPHVVANPDDARKLRQKEVQQLSPGTQKVIGTIDDPKNDAPPPVKHEGGGN